MLLLLLCPHLPHRHRLGLGLGLGHPNSPQNTPTTQHTRSIAILYCNTIFVYIFQANLANQTALLSIFSIQYSVWASSTTHIHIMISDSRTKVENYRWFMVVIQHLGIESTLRNVSYTSSHPPQTPSHPPLPLPTSPSPTYTSHPPPPPPPLCRPPSPRQRVGTCTHNIEPTQTGTPAADRR